MNSNILSEQKSYNKLIKILVPEIKGDYYGNREGMFLVILFGNDELGTGLLLNQPAFFQEPSWGSLIYYLSPNKFTNPFVIEYEKTNLKELEEISTTNYLVPQNIVFQAKQLYKTKMKDKKKIREIIEKLPFTSCVICNKPCDLFLVSNEEWQSNIPLELQSEVICLECYKTKFLK